MFPYWLTNFSDRVYSDVNIYNPDRYLTEGTGSYDELTFGAVGSLFNPQRDIGDLDGKVIFVTGGKVTVPPEDHPWGTNKISTYR